MFWINLRYRISMVRINITHLIRVHLINPLFFLLEMLYFYTVFISSALVMGILKPHKLLPLISEVGYQLVMAREELAQWNAQFVAVRDAPPPKGYLPTEEEIEEIESLPPDEMTVHLFQLLGRSEGFIEVRKVKLNALIEQKPDASVTRLIATSWKRVW